MELFLISTCVLGIVLSMLMLRKAAIKGVLPAGAMSAVLSIVTLLTVFPDMATLSNGYTNNILEVNGGYALSTITSMESSAMELLAISLLGVFLGELLVVSTVTPRLGRRATAHPWTALHSRYFVILCLVIGTVGRILLSGQSGTGLAERGTAHGLGVLTTTNWLLVAAIIVVLVDTRCMSKLTRVMVVLYCLGLTLSGLSRSPLLLLGCFGVVLGANVLASRRYRVRDVVGAVVIGYVVAIAVSLLSIYRGAKTNHQTFAIGHSLATVAASPLSSLPTTGQLQTFDGTLFTQLLRAQGIHGSLSNWAVAITTFVPSQIWPAKPVPLSSTLSADYLHFGASGMFLSGPGFAELTLGSSVASLAACAILTAIVSFYLARSITSPITMVYQSLAIFLLVTFWIEGDAFDIYYALSIVVASWVAAWGARWWVGISGTTRNGPPSSSEGSDDLVQKCLPVT